MINAKDLDLDFRPKSTYSDGASITLGTIQQALTDETAKESVPIAFYPE